MAKFENSIAETLACRSSAPKDLRPLFDHMIKLAMHSHSAGYPKRAGIELRKARKLAK